MADGSTDDTNTETALPDIGSYLIGRSGIDTIHNATCCIEYLAEIKSEYTAESPPDGEHGINIAYGEWMVLSTIAQAMRHGIAQEEAEYRQRREKVDRMCKLIDPDGEEPSDG